VQDGVDLRVQDVDHSTFCAQNGTSYCAFVLAAPIQRGHAHNGRRLDGSDPGESPHVLLDLSRLKSQQLLAATSQLIKPDRFETLYRSNVVAIRLLELLPQLCLQRN
jgi:hypothetical protein